jgi:hypothetical protein
MKGASLVATLDFLSVLTVITVSLTDIFFVSVATTNEPVSFVGRVLVTL